MKLKEGNVMCDYSLMGVPNHLAQEGEELVTHRFGTGSIGLASVADAKRLQAWAESHVQKGVAATLKKFLETPRPRVCAICVPPGATLGIVENGRVGQLVKFDQLSERVNNYRDAIRYDTGDATLLQRLPVGMHMKVMSMAGSTEREPMLEGIYERDL